MQTNLTAVVTGSQGGIGMAIVKKMISQSIQVIALDLNEGQLHLDNKIVSIRSCDISDEHQVIAFWDRLANENRKVDILVNNAGIYPAVGWESYDVELAKKVLNINILGTFLMSQRFAKQIDEGVIVNVSSVSAFTGSSDPLYGASKAGLIGLTKSLAITLAPRIRVNAIAPSLVKTPMMDKVPEAVLVHYHQQELLPTGIEVEAIADAVMFLASSLSKNMTGSTLDINNGIYLR